jgi:serine/threonine protein kinase/Flp pilus assembly protein TadD
VEAYLDAVKAGRRPDRRQFLARYPEIAEVLAECLDGLEFILGAAADLPLPIPNQADILGGPASEPRPAVPLGDFHILREVGRGGMGVVYEAEQLSLRRRVALKVLPFASALDARQLQRFQNEAQAAAHIHHTNIVPVYAVGCERGVHYYVMEYIEGQTVAALIRDLRQQAGLESVAPGPPSADTAPTLAAELSTQRSSRSPGFFRTVASLGLQAAEALEHAHELGVVHRDIKPANLLVDVRGHLWITDFGLAHIQGDTKLTMTGDLVGTLRYMSPEQALAWPGLVDHRTDIYSLGITLYELLTLEPAFRGRDRQEVLRRIEREEPQSPRRRSPAIPVDLETIVLKALAKEPQARYATARELADDLRRFLEDRPIRARKPGLGQRTVRWARRHKPVVVSATAVLVLAVLALAVSTVVVALERREAIRQRDTARRAVDAMYTKVAEQWLEQEPEMEEVQREFLREALRFYQEFARERGTDPAVRLATGTAYRRVGDIEHKLGEQARAEEAYGQAIALFRRLAHDYPTQPEYQEALADSCHHLGLLLARRKRGQEAEEAYRQAVALWEKLLAGAPDSPRYQYGLAASLSELGSVFHQARGRRQDAEDCYRKALALLEPLVADTPKPPRDAAYQHQLGTILSHLADLPGSSGTLEQHRQLLEEAVRHQRLACTLRPRHPTYRQYLGGQLSRLGRLLARLRQVAEAEDAYREARAIRAKLVDDFPQVPGYRTDLANDCTDLADLLYKHGRQQDARDAYRQALALREGLVATSPAAPHHRRDLAWQLATCLDQEFRNADRAVRLAREAVELAPGGADCWRTLGVACYRAGEGPAAVTALQKVVKLRSGGDAQEWLFLAMAYWQVGDRKQARYWYDRSIQWMETNKVRDEKLRLVRAEAAALLGVTDKPVDGEADPRARKE